MTHIKACCESIARTGFGTLQISEAMLLDYKKIVDGYSSISAATKASFSFAKDTDGFFPFGAEYSSVEDQPDLCERFCYWPAHSSKRKAFEFTRSEEPVRLLENEIAILAGSLLTELSDYAIPAAYHAVLTPRTPIPRSSLIYFVNPDAEQELTGFFRHQTIDLKGAVNARHTGFGNQPLQLT